MKVLWVSQLVERERIATEGFPDEKETAPVALAAVGVASTTVVDAMTEDLPDPDGYDAVVVGGSVGSANDPEPWRARLCAWMRTVRRPFLGICGGHQLWACAYGGVVEPMGFQQLGAFALELPGVPGFDGHVVQMHGDHVAVVPGGAEVWARDAACVQALRYGPATWTFQFHPEITPDTLPLASAQWPAERRDDAALARALAGGHAILRAWVEAARRAG